MDVIIVLLLLVLVVLSYEQYKNEKQISLLKIFNKKNWRYLFEDIKIMIKKVKKEVSQNERYQETQKREEEIKKTALPIEPLIKPDRKKKNWGYLFDYIRGIANWSSIRVNNLKIRIKKAKTRIEEMNREEMLKKTQKKEEEIKEVRSVIEPILSVELSPTEEILDLQKVGLDWSKGIFKFATLWVIITNQKAMVIGISRKSALLWNKIPINEITFVDIKGFPYFRLTIFTEDFLCKFDISQDNVKQIRECFDKYIKKSGYKYHSYEEALKNTEKASEIRYTCNSCGKVWHTPVEQLSTAEFACCGSLLGGASASAYCWWCPPVGCILAIPGMLLGAAGGGIASEVGKQQPATCQNCHSSNVNKEIIAFKKYK